jgi:tRNA/tmRNA/rRNA uracil-C5-methylase (TrmA/RlmC/RlmD family)
MIDTKVIFIEKHLGGEKIMVKILNRSGKEENFDSKDVERDLEASGLPERVAKEVAERVEDRVQDRWTNAKVNEQVDIELRRLEEDIQRAHSTYSDKTRATPMSAQTPTTIPPDTDYRNNAGNRSESFIPETEREQHRPDY